MPHTQPQKAQQGFSILEALVAITLVALAFLPLLALQSQLIRTTISIERAEERVRVQANALAYLRSVNPLLRSTGEEDLGIARLNWSSTPLTQARAPLNMSGETGRYNIQLFDVTATLTFKNERVVTFQTRQLGWIATKPPEAG